MIPIKKGPEPHELTEYRLRKGANYENMPQNVKEAVLNSLMQEQGFLCAYCMCRIPQKSQKISVRIEHIQPQSQTKDLKALDYKNMLAVCPGNQVPKNEKLYNLRENRLTCDAHRGNNPLTVNPLISQTLRTIRYKSDGTIYSEDSAVNTDLNRTLNLNSAVRQLPETRKRVLDELRKKAHQRRGPKSFETFVSRELECLRLDPKKPPYVGILMDWLERHQK